MTKFVTATSDRENKKTAAIFYDGLHMNATKAYNPNCLCSRQPLTRLTLLKVAGLQIFATCFHG